MSEFDYDLPHIEPLLIVISGPSGVGKDTVIQRMKERNLPFHFVVTATTRPPRPTETHGRDYFFHSRDEFAEMIEKGELLEFAVVYDDYKGIPKAQVRDALASGKDVIMRLDVQGASTIHKLCPDTLMIFLTAEEDDIVHRLEKRATEDPEGLKLRIATARQEMNQIDKFEYVVYNHDYHLDVAVDSIISIIVAEHHRIKQRKVTL
jgi:guanylate kinase